MASTHGLVQRPAPFKLERFFEKHEFTARHLLCCSDCEPLSMRELLEMADPDARRRWDDLKLSYTEPSGLTALREAVASELYGGALGPQQLLVCAPEEGVYLTMKALLRPGDRVVCCYPAYQSLYELALATGCTVDLWEPTWDTDAGRMRFDVSRLEALIGASGGGGGGGRQPVGNGEREERAAHEGGEDRDHRRGRRHQAGSGGGGGSSRGPCRLVVVNFPHNPTGETVSGAEQARIVEAARRAGAYLFSDEMYWRSEPDESLRLPPAATLYDKAITLCGLSKSWALPGLRIGWIATRDAALLARVAALKDYTTICSAGPSEVLGLIAVRATDRITARCRGLIAKNTALADAFFRRWGALFGWRPPTAGPIAFPRVHLEALQHLDAGGGGSRRVSSSGAAADPADSSPAPQAAGAEASVKDAPASAPPPAAGGGGGGGGGAAGVESVEDFCSLLVEEAGVLLLPASVYDHAPSEARGHFRLGLGRAGTGAALAALDAFLEGRFPFAAAGPRVDYGATEP